MQVIIGHSKLVETGLDARLSYPELLRNWKLPSHTPAIQPQIVAYRARSISPSLLSVQEGTLQTKCLRLMGKKLLVALTREGKFAGEGLHDIEEDDDMLAAQARELVEKDCIGETADAVWSQLKEVYDQLPKASRQMPTLDNEEPVFADAIFDDSEVVIVADDCRHPM